MSNLSLKVLDNLKGRIERNITYYSDLADIYKSEIKENVRFDDLSHPSGINSQGLQDLYEAYSGIVKSLKDLLPIYDSDEYLELVRKAKQHSAFEIMSPHALFYSNSYIVVTGKIHAFENYEAASNFATEEYEHSYIVETSGVASISKPLDDDDIPF